MGKINILNVYNWIPISMRWPQAVMYQSRSPQLMIFDSCSVHVSKMLDAHALARYHIVGAVTGTPETRHGDIKAVSFKEKIHGNSSKSGSKTLSVSKAESVLCYFCGKNNHPTANCHTRTSEFTNHQNRPYVGSEAHGRLVKATGDRDWIPNFKELKGLMS